MGAKTWMLVYSDGDVASRLKGKPAPDREAGAALAARLFPGETFEPLDDGDLSYTNPPDDEIFIGVYPGVTVVAAAEFGIDYPSRLPRSFIANAAGNTVHLHAMHSVVDWFACAVWKDGQLTRSLSLSPDSGVLEDIGAHLPFEEPYWAGRHRAIAPEDDDPEHPYPFIFHPLDLGEAALIDFFGYCIEGRVDKQIVQADEIALPRFRRVQKTSAVSVGPAKKPWWKVW
ncbi:MAG TPA: hypothetical protein VGN52_11140 [Burkholderiales bacterium]